MSKRAAHVASWLERPGGWSSPTSGGWAYANATHPLVELYLDDEWVDITAYVYYRDRITITRGKSDEASQISPSSCRFTINNRDGRFSPRNPTGTYYGLIGRNTPVRVSVVRNGIQRFRFYGEISSWPSKWDTSGKDVWVEIEADGVMRRLGQGQAPLKSALRRAIMTANPVGYWPLEDGSEATSAASAVEGNMAARTINFDYASNDTLPGSGPLPTILSTNALETQVCKLRVPVPDSGTDEWRVEFVYYTPTAPAGLTQLMEIEVNSDTYEGHRIYLNGSANIRIISDLVGGGITSPFISVTSSNLGGQWNRVYLQMSASGGTTTAKLALIPITTGIEESGTTTYAGTPGNVLNLFSDFNSATDTNLQGGSVGHYTVFDSTDVDVFEDAFDGHSGELPSERLRRLSEESDLSTLIPTYTDDEQPMGAQRLSTLLDLLRECETTEVGRLIEPRDQFGLAFINKSMMYNQDPVLTLDYSQHHLSTPLDPVDDDRYTRNDVTATRPRGSFSQQTLDEGALSTQAPPNGVGRYDDSVTVNVESDDQLGSQAMWRVHLGTVDEPRYPKISVNLRHSSFTESIERMNGALAVDVGQRINIENPPAWMAPDTISLLVEGYTEVIGTVEHDITYTTSPYTPHNVASLDDEFFGHLDTEGCETNGPINSTSTVLNVVTDVGATRWIDSATYPDDFPFDILVGGEVMTVNACVGTALSQTFDVTRSINGVVKSHASGTRLSLAYPAVIGL